MTKLPKELMTKLFCDPPPFFAILQEVKNAIGQNRHDNIIMDDWHSSKIVSEKIILILIALIDESYFIINIVLSQVSIVSSFDNDYSWRFV